MNKKIHINKNTVLDFNCLEDSKTIIASFTKPFHYYYYSCIHEGMKYFIRIKEQFRNDKWERTSKSFATSLTAKRWESKLTDIIKSSSPHGLTE